MRVWVVGGTSGIGKAVYRRLRQTGHNALNSGADYSVTMPDKLRKWVAEQGPFEGIVYSAGITSLDWLADIDEQEMLDIYDVNVVGLVRVLQACPEARRVVVIGSDAARRPMRTSLAYCASKAALDMAVKVIARERASEEFAINIVAPGMTDQTNMQEYIDKRVPEVRGWSEQHAAQYESSQIPIGRRAMPSEIAEVVSWVLTTKTPYMNGATIEVNGGR